MPDKVIAWLLPAGITLPITAKQEQSLALSAHPPSLCVPCAERSAGVQRRCKPRFYGHPRSVRSAAGVGGCVFRPEGHP